jgi:hypothetical protein
MRYFATCCFDFRHYDIRALRHIIAAADDITPPLISLMPHYWPLILIDADIIITTPLLMPLFDSHYAIAAASCRS